jgi:hypothetical protein
MRILTFYSRERLCENGRNAGESQIWKQEKTNLLIVLICRGVSWSHLRRNKVSKAPSAISTEVERRVRFKPSSAIFSYRCAAHLTRVERDGVCKLTIAHPVLLLVFFTRSSIVAFALWKAALLHYISTGNASVSWFADTRLN